MSTDAIKDCLNDRLNRDFPQCTAGDIRHGDRITIGNEWVTVDDARPVPGIPTMIRITGRLGEPSPGPVDLDDIVTIRIRREASIRRATR